MQYQISCVGGKILEFAPLLFGMYFRVTFKRVINIKTVLFLKTGVFNLETKASMQPEVSDIKERQNIALR